MVFFDIVVVFVILGPFLLVIIKNYQAHYKRTSEFNDSRVHIYISIYTWGGFLTNFYLLCIENMIFLEFKIFKIFSRVQCLILLIWQIRKKYENNVKGRFEGIMPVVYLKIMLIPCSPLINIREKHVACFEILLLKLIVNVLPKKKCIYFPLLLVTEISSR